ncbi:unnamed protein product [Schistosoma margrebowiei]|uniref:Uncharacterized protein n=1 Tax=Schistosoma margrebowiei TaxID=48269 RepID=A0A183LVJ1_9TREM|nr:unnamed protein product [Schistosoma margrebowiei]
MSSALTGSQTNGAHGLQYPAGTNGIVIEGSQQETVDPGFVLLGTRQQGVPVILKDLVLLDGFDTVLSSFTVRDVTTELYGPRLTSCRTEIIDWISLKLKKHLTCKRRWIVASNKIQEVCYVMFGTR